MSKIIVEFNTDNAAFAEDFEGEVKYVLQQVVEKCEPETDCLLFDSNGNSVGTLVSTAL